MVVGKLPFFAEYEGDLFRKIQTCKYKFPADDGEGRAVSQGARSLIHRIFKKDPALRPTAAQILEDPWLTTHCKGKEEDKAPEVEKN